MHKLEPFGRYRGLAAAIVTLAAVFGASGWLAGASAAALPSGCSQSGQIVSCSFTFTSGSNPFTVPAGVSSIHVVAVGGTGSAVNGPQAGAGAVVTGDLPVSGGSTLYAVVGGDADGGTPGAGGGGGVTGTLSGGAGGGASDVRTSPNDLSSRLLVAAGGGGSGGDGAPVTQAEAGVGGAGGGTAGGSAIDENGGSPYTAGGGGGGGTTSGGAGGSPGLAFGCFPASPPFLPPSCTFSGGSGGSGESGVGGTGGSPGGLAVSSPCSPEPCGTVIDHGGGGGGGGGGLFGGGGGGGSVIDGGGGGGGSNLVPPGGSAAVDTTGIPLVQISYKLVPTSKVQCMNGGWRNYPQFKNQGDCVSFIETGK